MEIQLSDPMGEMRKMYSYFGIELSSETEEAWTTYLNNDPIKKKYPKHKYTMADFNLTKEELAEEFREYIDRMSERVDPKILL